MSELELARARAMARQRAARISQRSTGEEIAARNAAQFRAATGQRVLDRTEATNEANRIAERDMARAQISRPEAAIMGLSSGQTLGFADEIGGMVGGDGLNDASDRALELARTAYPGMTTAAEIGGMMVSPAAALAPVTKTIKGAAAVGGALGAVDAAGRAEGTAVERIDDAAKGGAISFLTGGLASAALKGGSRAVQATFNRAEKRPTIEALKQARNAAYAQVRKSGIEFSEDEMITAWSRLDDLAKDPRWDLDGVSEVDKAAFDAMRVLERRASLGRPISLNNLDKTRQKLWDVYKKSDHPFVLEAIDVLDDVVSTKADGSEVMGAARAANSAYAKSQLLENAFRKAQLQTAGSGSGGNILNKYRQAVTSIITKPHEAKWFTPEEIAVMEQFVFGDAAENTLRRAGKLAPGGNGLMTALNVYAASIDPSLLAITGAATAAKGLADRSAMQGSERLLDNVAGVIRPPQPQPNLTPAATAGVSAQSRF